MVRTRIASVLDAIQRREPTLHAFVDLDDAQALRRAEWLDRLAPAQRGPLHGLPVAVKEIIDVAGRCCAWGSPLHAGRRAAEDAPVVRRLLQAGAVVIGISASTEYALAAPPATVHPLDPSRSPGASSSGSAAAVAAGLVPVALGSQTIGSTIRPAGYCGIVGYKPSHGRYPTAGVLTLSERLDDVGVLAATVGDVVALDRVLAAQDRSPPGAVSADARPGAPDAVRGWCAVAPWFTDPLTSPVAHILARTAERIAGTGAAFRRLELDGWIGREEARATDILLTTELASRHPELLAPIDTRVSADLREMALRGPGWTDAQRHWAIERQRAITTRLHELLRPGEIALAPATVDTAPLLAEGSGSRAPQRLWTLAGMPALTLPAGRHAGLPVGVQLVARHGEDAVLFEAARYLETLGTLPEQD